MLTSAPRRSPWRAIFIIGAILLAAFAREMNQIDGNPAARARRRACPPRRGRYGLHAGGWGESLTWRPLGYDEPIFRLGPPNSAPPPKAAIAP